MRAALLALILLASGCASSIMQGYVGKSLQEAMIGYGPPTNAFDMPDGTRAFQWVVSSTYVTPTTVNTTGQVNPYGYNPSWSSQTTIRGGQAISGRCVYTMIARWEPDHNAWIFTEFRRPSPLCE